MTISFTLFYLYLEYMTIFLIFHPIQVICIHYKSRIAAAIRGL